MNRFLPLLLLGGTLLLGGCNFYNENYSCQSGQWVRTGEENTHPPTRNAQGYLHC